MVYGEITVGDLRELLSNPDIPDKAFVTVKPADPDDFASCEAHKIRQGGEKILIPARPAKVWNYNTRFVANVYGANDDRFEESSIIVIEIGEPCP